MQATIEIDLGPFADEWEAVAVRPPRCGDVYWYRDQPIKATQDWKTEPMIIVRRKWVFPAWLKARWYCEDPDGSQWGYEVKPSHQDGEWYSSGPVYRLDDVVDIPRIGGDWRQSLRENPNWKASQE